MSDKAKQKSALNKPEPKEIQYKEVSLFRNPITVILTTIVLIYDQLVKLTNYFLTHRKVMFALFAILLSSFFEGPHKQVRFILYLF